jgi:hypothetical protein
MSVRMTFENEKFENNLEKANQHISPLPAFVSLAPLFGGKVSDDFVF